MYRNRFTKPLHLGRSPINLKMHPILWHIMAVILSAYNYLLCTFIKTLCAHNPHKLSLFFITKAQWVRSLDLALSYNLQAVVGSNTLVQLTSLSPIRRGFAPGFVNYKKGCTRLAAACDKVYQLLAHGRWFQPGTPDSSTTKTGRYDIAEILLKVALKHQKSNQIITKGWGLLTPICKILDVTLHEPWIVGEQTWVQNPHV